MGDFVLGVLDEGLQQDELLLVLGVLDGLRHFQSLVQIAVLVVAFGQVQLVLGHLRVVLHQLLVHAGCVREVLAHVVAVRQQGHAPTPRAQLQLIVKVRDRLSRP